MASNSRQRTTFAKLNREQKVRERRREKELKREARKHEAAVQRDAPSAPTLELDPELQEGPPAEAI